MRHENDRRCSWLSGLIIAKIAVASAAYCVDRPYDYLVPEKFVPDVLPGVRVVVPFGSGNRRSEGIVLAVTGESAFDKLKSVESVLDEKPVLNSEMLHLALWMRERFFCTVYDSVKAMLPAGLWYSVSAVYRASPDFERDNAYASVGKSAVKKRILDIIYAHGGACEFGEIASAMGDKDPTSALSSLVKAGLLITDGKAVRHVGDKTVEMAQLIIPAEDAMRIAASKRRRAPMQASIIELMCTVGRASVREICYFTGAGKRSVYALAGDGVIDISEEEAFRRPEYTVGESKPIPELNQSQKNAFDGIRALCGHGADAALLFGVTGSGKTSVYVHLISDALKRNKTAILLVPEIALTPQMLSTFSSYFGEDIAVLHSSLDIGERYDEWKRIKSGQARVVIGTRSAVFAPVSDLGMIIIDEEQEESYKSDNSPRYHARDIAKYRCAQNGALLLLASATPDICSRYSAETGKYHYFVLPERFNKMELPEVRIVDMKSELRRGCGGSISTVLRDELESNISRGEQSILFINRRGSSKLITCAECGYTYKCPNCSVSLTYHSANRRLMCHYCGHSQPADAVCPECGGKLSFTGDGTQKVAEELESIFPGIEVLRMDTDTVSANGSHEAILSRFRDSNIPIMVGTQMVTKGLNFENVTLVGVISADQSLYCGDYRAAERTFSLITQVVGRSGRGAKSGRAVIQTFTPDNQTIYQASMQDYDSFYASEIELRSLTGSPPFAELFSVTASGAVEAEVERCCRSMRDIFVSKLSGVGGIRILGPAPLPVVKVNNRYRYRLTIAAQSTKTVRKLISDMLVYVSTNKKFKGVSVFADIDPYE